MIHSSRHHSSYSFLDFNHLALFTLKMAPRIILMGAIGYVSLGWAYEAGIMAAIDKVAIPILKNHVGYMGLGAIMPTFQWYSAWAVRITAALTAEALFELIAFLAKKILGLLFTKKPTNGIPLAGMV